MTTATARPRVRLPAPAWSGSGPRPVREPVVHRRREYERGPRAVGVRVHILHRGRLRRDQPARRRREARHRAGLRLGQHRQTLRRRAPHRRLDRRPDRQRRDRALRPLRPGQHVSVAVSLDRCDRPPLDKRVSARMRACRPAGARAARLRAHAAPRRRLLDRHRRRDLMRTPGRTTPGALGWPRQLPASPCEYHRHGSQRPRHNGKRRDHGRMPPDHRDCPAKSPRNLPAHTTRAHVPHPS